MKGVSSWGRLTNDPHQIISLSDNSMAVSQMLAFNPGIAFGNGRSYGDACLNSNGIIWDTKKLDHFINFDQHTGHLVCEAGVLLGDIQQWLMPQGWNLPVVPGTQWVTVGGAVANDIHGKNHHHYGSFGNHVRRIKLIRTSGEIIDCSPELQSELFAATVGGLGLTGVIIEVELQLCKVASPWLEMDTIPYGNLTEFYALASQSVEPWEYTVSWIDCVAQTNNRGIFMRANPAQQPAMTLPKERSLTITFTPPVSLINHWSLKLFNSLYFNLKRRNAGRSFIHYKPFFYPLDNLLQWNRLYGPKGFFQYQCVIPHHSGIEPVGELLSEIKRRGEGSILTVLKTFGEIGSVGLLSFPQPGITLALDFPNKGASTHKLFERLDAIVSEANGRLYLAKDARMPRELFEKGYPRFNEFLKHRDPGISSALSRRLMGY